MPTERRLPAVTVIGRDPWRESRRSDSLILSIATLMRNDSPGNGCNRVLAHADQRRRRPIPHPSPVTHAAHELPFVDYLRLCFRWTRFPRLERYADRSDVREFLDVMSKGLEPF
jgi:hypothetical protein